MSESLTKVIAGAPAEGADISELWAAAYSELRQLARARLRVSGPLTLLDTAGLVNDAYARLAGYKQLRVESRAHFLAYCSRVMRSVIIDLVRENQALRRGGDAQKITLNTAVGDIPSNNDEEPLRVNDALNDLAKLEPRLAQVVEMRYFGGYAESEIAEALGVTVRTVQRDWQKARVILQAMLASDS